VHGAIISFHAVERQRDDPQVGDLLRQLENTPQLLDVVASCITTCWDVQTFDANVGCCFAIHGFFIEDHPDMVDTLQSFYTQRGNQAISQRRGALFESMCYVALRSAVSPDEFIHRECQIKFCSSNLCEKRKPTMDFALELSDGRIRLYECKVSLDAYMDAKCSKTRQKRNQKLVYMSCAKWFAYLLGIDIRTILVSLRESQMTSEYMLQRLPVYGLEIMGSDELRDLLATGFHCRLPK
jgi:hypothetical protein